MRRTLKAILVVGTFAALVPWAWAQEPRPGAPSGPEQAPAAHKTPKADPDPDATGIRAGTKFAAELQSSVDAKTAKPGDEVSARVTQNVKESGRVVIRKGDRLVGTVTDVKSEAHGGSAVGIKFDRLIRGDATSHVNAILASILSTPGERSEGEGGEAPEPMASPGLAPRAGGGLLGGAASTVGATTGAVAGTAGGLGGSAAGTTRGTLGASSGTMVSTPLHSIRVGSSTSAEGSAESGSMLSTRQGNLRLESGTRLQFRVE